MQVNPEQLIASVQSFAPDYYIAVRNPQWVNIEHSLISCEVNFKHVGFEEWTPFCADVNDFMPYSKQIFDECAAGQWGTVQEYVPPPEPEEFVIQEQPVTQGAQDL